MATSDFSHSEPVPTTAKTIGRSILNTANLISIIQFSELAYCKQTSKKSAIHASQIQLPPLANQVIIYWYSIMFDVFFRHKEVFKKITMNVPASAIYLHYGSWLKYWYT